MKYTAIILRKIGESKENIKYERVAKKDFKSTDKTIDFNKDGKSFFVCLSGESYQDDKCKIYFYDFDTMDLIGLKTLITSNIKPEDLNKFTGKKMIEAIIAGAKNKSDSMGLLLMILPIVTLIIGVVIGHFIAPQVITVPVPQTPNIPTV